MATVLGAHSPKLATVRALRAKKGRREQKRFVVEGPTMLREALEAGWVPEALFATEAAYAELAGRDGLPVAQVYLITERSLAQLSDVESPAGVVTVFAHRFDPLDRLFAGNQPIALLAGVADPGNAGTLLRSAEAFGLAGAIFGNDGVEPYNPKVVRASMGALFRLRLAVAGPLEVEAAAARHGFALVATSRAGTPLPAARIPQRSVIAIGNERRGLGPWLTRRDLEVAIPQRGASDSLNAAVAGSIIFYAAMQHLEDAVSREP